MRFASTLFLVLFIDCSAQALPPVNQAVPAIQEQQATLVVGSEQDYPPFATGMTDAAASGFTVDLWKMVAAEAGLNYTIRVLPFHQLLQDFKEGKVNVLINLAISDERRKFAEFSVPHVTVHGAVFVRKGETGIRTEDDLANKSIIVLKADLAHDYAISKGWGKQLVLVDTSAEGMRLLASGKHDAMLLAKLAGMLTLKTTGLTSIEVLKAKAGFSQKFAFAVPKGRPELLGKINESLAIVKANGTYDELYEKWFGIYEVKEVGLRDLLKYMIPIILIFLGFAGYIFYRRQAERKEAEEKYRDLYDHAPDMFLSIEVRSETVIDCNKTLLDFMEYSREEIVGRSMHDLYHPDYAELVRAEFRTFLACKEVHGVELELRRKDGTNVFVSMSSTAVCDKKGAILYSRTVLRDITERKREDTYKEMSRKILVILNEPGELQNAIQRVLDVLKASTGCEAVGIRLQDGEDFPYYAQEGFSTEFLRTENSLIECGADGVVCRNKDGKVGLECTCGLVISGKVDPDNPLFTQGGSCWTNESFTLLDIPPDKDPRLHPRNKCIYEGYASVALVPIRENNRIVGLIHLAGRRKGCFTINTVELLEMVAAHIGVALMRKRAEEEKFVLEQQFQQTQKLESLGVLAGGIAHDFNNILAVIICYCSLAQQKPEEAVELMHEIEKAATRAAELCRQMLAYAGKAPFISTNIKMAALVDDMLRMLKATIGQNVLIKSALAEDLPLIRGDISQIRQVVMNLIINAAEAIGEAQGEIRVSLATSEIRAGEGDKDHLGKGITPGQYVCLEVADTGCGMDNEVKQHIFEPFYTTKFAGRGLGMSAVLGIVIAHRGALQVESQAGRGTTFRVYLPLQGSKYAEAEALRPVPSIAWQGHGTILLVEDEAQILLVAKALLKALGFDVLEAANGSEALELYRKQAEYITLVITDLGMPVMDGFNLFHELKKLTPELPIIISSGFGDVDVISRIAEGDVAGFLNKPYSFGELRKVLQSVVEKLPLKQETV